MYRAVNTHFNSRSYVSRLKETITDARVTKEEVTNCGVLSPKRNRELERSSAPPRPPARNSPRGNAVRARGHRAPALAPRGLPGDQRTVPRHCCPRCSPRGDCAPLCFHPSPESGSGLRGAEPPPLRRRFLAACAPSSSAARLAQETTRPPNSRSIQ